MIRFELSDCEWGGGGPVVIDLTTGLHAGFVTDDGAAEARDLMVAAPEAAATSFLWHAHA